MAGHANKDAIGILFTVAGGAEVSGESYKEINGTLNELIEKINEKDPKRIKLKVDEDEFIKELKKTLGNLDTANINLPINLSAKDVKNIKAINNEVKKETKAANNETKAAEKSIAVNAKKNRQIVERTQAYKDAVAAIKEYRKAVTSASKLKSHADIIRGDDLSVTSSNKRLTNAVGKIEAARLNMSKLVTTEALKTATKEEQDIIRKLESSAYNKLTSSFRKDESKSALETEAKAATEEVNLRSEGNQILKELVSILAKLNTTKGLINDFWLDDNSNLTIGSLIDTKLIGANKNSRGRERDLYIGSGINDEARNLVDTFNELRTRLAQIISETGADKNTIITSKIFQQFQDLFSRLTTRDVNSEINAQMAQVLYQKDSGLVTKYSQALNAAKKQALSNGATSRNLLSDEGVAAEIENIKQQASRIFETLIPELGEDLARNWADAFFHSVQSRTKGHIPYWKKGENTTLSQSSEVPLDGSADYYAEIDKYYKEMLSDGNEVIASSQEISQAKQAEAEASHEAASAIMEENKSSAESVQANNQETKTVEKKTNAKKSAAASSKKKTESAKEENTETQAAAEANQKETETIVEETKAVEEQTEALKENNKETKQSKKTKEEKMVDKIDPRIMQLSKWSPEEILDNYYSYADILKNAASDYRKLLTTGVLTGDLGFKNGILDLSKLNISESLSTEGSMVKAYAEDLNNLKIKYDELDQGLLQYLSELGTLDGEHIKFKKNVDDAIGTADTRWKKLVNFISTFIRVNEQALSQKPVLKQQLDQLRELISTGGYTDYGKASDLLKKVTQQGIKDGLFNLGLLGKFASTFGTRVRSLLSGAIIGKLTMELRNVYNNVKNIDGAMTQLKIVTGATDSQMTKFLSNAIDLSKELGASVADVLKSIETFSRLGYNLEESSILSQYASILSKVADVSSEEATKGLTSILKGYGFDPSDSEHISDVLVKVGQEYAVSASELMTAYEKAGSALSATNTSFEKSAALIAAANASVQDASVVGKQMPKYIVIYIKHTGITVKG